MPKGKKPIYFRRHPERTDYYRYVASCSTKRSILFGEKIGGLSEPVSHLHITFTIPKLLRAWFRKNRSLLKLLPQSASWAVKTYFSESLETTDGYTGGVYCVQTYGGLYNFHPHVHALILPGIVKEGVLHEQKNISGLIISRLFRARLLELMQAEGVISREVVDMLLSWNHTSGFNVHLGERIHGAQKETMETVARYMTRPPISTDRVKYNPETGTVTVYEKNPKRFPAPSKTYPLDEFFALLACHIPAPYETLTFYYGIYSSSYRGKQNREQKQELETIESKGTAGTADGKITSAWARLIHKIFEIDPLKCDKCGQPMRFIAFIIRTDETNKILEYIGQTTIRPPPLTKPDIAHEIHGEGKSIDYIPPVDSYVIDPIYPD